MAKKVQTGYNDPKNGPKWPNITELFELSFKDVLPLSDTPSFEVNMASWKKIMWVVSS